MRILHLVGTAGDHGGILSVIRALATAPAAAGCEHVLWVNSAFRQTRRPELPCRFSPHALDETGNHLKFLFAAGRAWPGLRRLLDAEPFDVVHAHSRGALPLVLAAARRRPALFTNHTYARRTGLYRWAARSARVRWVLLTPNMARHYGLRPEPGRIEILSACCADEFFRRPLARARGAGAGPVRLVGVGNLVRWKRWDLVVEALGRLTPDRRARVRFDLWGPTPADADSQRYAAELRTRIAAAGLGETVRLGGPSANIADAVAAADLFVLPSTNEPCSVALIEALALGVPALVSASGGNGDIVAEGRTGLLFQPGSAEDLAGRLAALLDGAVPLAGPAAIRESVRERSATTVGATYAGWYRELAALRGGAAGGSPLPPRS